MAFYWTNLRNVVSQAYGVPIPQAWLTTFHTPTQYDWTNLCSVERITCT